MKATEKGLYCYSLEDGRTALTRRNLDYATNDQGYLDLASVRGDDAKTINLIADPQIGFLLAELYGKKWVNPETAINMSDQQRKQLPYYQHCAIMANGKVHVRDGKFVPLEKYTKNATAQDLAAMLWDVAAQAALAQLAIVAENISKLEEAV